jgi:hypothetical protein
MREVVPIHCCVRCRSISGKIRRENTMVEQLLFERLASLFGSDSLFAPILLLSLYLMDIALIFLFQLLNFDFDCSFSDSNCLT